MDYLIWQDDVDEGEAVIRGGWPGSKVSFHSGSLIGPDPGPIELSMNKESQGVLNDNLVVLGGPHVFSKPLLNVLRECGVDNVQEFPCIIRNLVTGDSFDSHSIVSIVGKIGCIDHDNSEVDYLDGDSSKIFAYGYLTLDESKIGGPPLFLLAEMPVQIIIRRDIAEAIEQAGITGVRFVEQGDGYAALPPIDE